VANSSRRQEVVRLDCRMARKKPIRCLGSYTLGTYLVLSLFYSTIILHINEKKFMLITASLLCWI